MIFIVINMSSSSGIAFSERSQGAKQASLMVYRSDE